MTRDNNKLTKKFAFPLSDSPDIKAARIWLLIAVGFLLAVGVIMVYSVTSADLTSKGKDPFTDVIKQLCYIGIGLAFMLTIVLFIPIREQIGHIMTVYYVSCVFLIILTPFLGTSNYGAQRWLEIGPISFQPSEFLKIALLLMFIRILYDYKVGKLQFRAAIFQTAVFVFGPLIIMYYTQSDLGTAAICIVGIFAAFWISGVNKYLLIAIGLIIIAMIAFAVFGVSYRSSRMIYLNPWNDGQGGLGAGYNIIHSYYAIAEGGIFGVGLGASHEKYGYLFASDSDFIFAVIAEEGGMIAALFIIVAFIIILLSSFDIAASSETELGKMIAGAFAVMLVFQAFLNIGCTIGVFPTTGKPLPFISSGGSAVISSLMVVGIILSVARENISNADPRKRRDELRVIRTGSQANASNGAARPNAARPNGSKSPKGPASNRPKSAYPQKGASSTRPKSGLSPKAGVRPKPGGNRTATKSSAPPKRASQSKSRSEAWRKR